MNNQDETLRSKLYTLYQSLMNGDVDFDFSTEFKTIDTILNKNRLSTELNQLAQTINAKLLLLYKKNYPQDKVRQITPQNELVELFARYDRTYQAFINNGSKI
ncbi:hypothetical protein [Loigolactobacillus backii]|uniref:hypothetical protein n=1 Tax=Loigolactobacillus backii TaxID=375175 RepID=UPI0022FD836B|nr:hypothetical protein [Loigolactobacillus backii]MDA5388228.1 hypothetical protein [Loigolactobacillus backii]MDA5390669.1 hypothetical protein [Loigolactobacillus backii]